MNSLRKFDNPTEKYRGLAARPAPLPRRTTEEDARRIYRRDVLRLPGPVDVWLHTSMAGSSGGPSGAGTQNPLPLRADEVRCTVQMQRAEAADDGSGFCDADTYVLYLTVTAAAGPYAHEQRTGPRLALQTYCGWPESLDAPDWARWHPGQTVRFRQRKSSVAQFVRDVVGRDVTAAPAPMDMLRSGRP